VYQCVNIFWIGSHFMKFGLQHPIFSFDYSNHNTSQIVDSLKNLVTRADCKSSIDFIQVIQSKIVEMYIAIKHIWSANILHSVT
jgi:hypothetical protein